MTPSEPFDTSSHEDLKLMQGFPPPPDKRVTRANGIWEPPYNRWAYQNIRRLWPTAPIPPAMHTEPMPLGDDPGIAHLQVARRDGSVADFDTFLRQTFTDSLVVIDGDRIVYEHYQNGMTAETPHIMFSCTKSFIGLFGLMAIEEGLVAEDSRIGDILPDLSPGSGFADASFGQVLDMTASLRFDETYDDPEAEIHDYATVLGVGSGGLDGRTIYDYLNAMETDGARPHGAAFHYQTPQADMVNWVVNRVTGLDFITLMKTRLWDRIGATGEANVMLDPDGTLFAGGGLNATARDMARFAAMILNDGTAGGAQVLSKAVIDTLSTGGSTEAFLRGPSAEEDMANGHWSYRAQWWIRNTPGSEAITAIGIYGQWIYIDRLRNVAIVKQSSQAEADSWYFHDYTVNAFDRIVRCVAEARA